jgi:hypothetical protein
MTTLGQVVESEGACACDTSYTVDDAADGSAAGGDPATLAAAAAAETAVTGPPATAVATSLRPMPTGSAAAVVGAAARPPDVAHNVPARWPPAPLTAAAKPGPTGRRLTLMLSRTMKKLRQNLIAGLLDHEICTHGEL